MSQETLQEHSPHLLRCILSSKHVVRESIRWPFHLLYLEWLAEISVLREDHQTLKP
jgi:hypothetical protein